MTRITHTFAELAVSRQAYNEIAGLLKEAEYYHCFIDERDPAGPIDMHGIALVPKEAEVETISKTQLGELKELMEQGQAPYLTKPPHERTQADYNDFMARIGYAVQKGQEIAINWDALAGNQERFTTSPSCKGYSVRMSDDTDTLGKSVCRFLPIALGIWAAIFAGLYMWGHSGGLW